MPSLLDPTYSELEGNVVTPNDLFADEMDDRLGDTDSVSNPISAYGQQSPAVDPTSPIPGGGALLEEPKASKVFRAIDKEVTQQDRLAKNREEEGKHWDRIKRGVQFSILEKTEDQSVYRAILPPGVDDTQQPIPNKVADLCNKQVSQILIDPPLPNPKPDGDNDRSRGALDLAKRFLRADGDASGTNDQELWREVLTMNRTRKSAFVYVWVDPTAGGWRPKQKLAHPRATDPQQALMAPALDHTGQPVIDQVTGQPIMERATEPTLRYIAEDQQGKQSFVQHPAEAAREWLPKHRRKILSPNQVRTVPASATAFEAHSIILIMWEPLSEAKKRFPVLNSLSPAQLKAVCAWKPKRWKTIIPEAQRPKETEGADVTDGTLVWWYHKFCRISPDYQDGAEIAVNGATVSSGPDAANGAQDAGFILCRDTLREDVEMDDGSLVPVLMEPPIAQFRAMIDVECGDPMGDTPVKQYGGANEIRAHLYLAALEDIDVRLHPNQYLTSTSNLTREDINRRDGTPLEVLTKDDMPTFEERPPLPPNLVQMLDRVEKDMNVGANLNETAQALDSSYAASGEAKKVSIAQAKVQLAQDWQGFINGCCQYWKIKLQTGQARLKTPQLVRLAGENRSYQASHFVGADLIGISAVALMPGSGTMMSPAEKSQYLTSFQQNQWLDPDQAGELARASMTDDLGLPPSPHEEHIDRCISDWLEGPPAGWMEAYQHNQQLGQKQQAYQQQADQDTQSLVSALTAQGTDPQQAQQLAAAHVQKTLGPPPQPMELPTPFTPRANDEEPGVAKIQATKLSKLMSSTEYAEQPAEWRTLIDQKYQSAAYAAGIVTVRQQAQAQQQANDPNAALFQKFMQAIQNKAIGLVEQMLAKATDASVTAGPEQGAAAPGGEGAPAEPPVDQTAENDKDRQHEIATNEQKHGHKMEQIAAQAVGSSLAKADRKAAREQLKPTPSQTTPQQ